MPWGAWGAAHTARMLSCLNELEQHEAGNAQAAEEEGYDRNAWVSLSDQITRAHHAHHACRRDGGPSWCMAW